MEHIKCEHFFKQNHIDFKHCSCQIHVKLNEKWFPTESKDKSKCIYISINVLDRKLTFLYSKIIHII